MKGLMIKKFFNKPRLLYIAVVFSLISFIFTFLYYKGILQDNFIVYFTWPLSIILIVRAMGPFKQNKIKKDNYKLFLIIGCLTLIYWLTHMYNYNSAPWSDYGLFDDAAWDIFITLQKCFTSRVFEIIYWDDTIGLISRELLFHYYMSILFNFLGYNMRVFNFGLLFLSYITIVFTTLIAKRLFKNDILTFMCGILLNFFPLHYTQVFMGHRYAICLPMITISIYFIVRSLQEKDTKCSLIGGVFAGFAMESAIMGKQYIWALLGALIVYIIFNFKKRKEFKNYISLLLFILIGYLITCTPLYSYIFTHKGLYRAHEMAMIKEFFDNLHNNGIKTLFENINILFTMLFSYSGNNSRQFSDIFPVFTWYYTVLLVIGSIYSFIKKKWYLIVLMLLIPIAGNVVAHAYDFRVLIIAPSVAIIIIAGLDYLTTKIFNKFNFNFKYYKFFITFCTILLIIEPTKYLYNLANDPNSQYFLNHRDLMASRYIQDVVVDDGNEPNYLMKKNEFRRKREKDNYDVFAATLTSYAHINAFLEPYNYNQILSIFENFPYIGTDTNILTYHLLETIRNYESSKKDLVLVFEYGEELDYIIDKLSSLDYVNYSEYSDEINLSNVKMIKFYINNSDVVRFKKDIPDLFGDTVYDE